jgi:hypothetical protein
MSIARAQAPSPFALAITMFPGLAAVCASDAAGSIPAAALETIQSRLRIMRFVPLSESGFGAQIPGRRMLGEAAGETIWHGPTGVASNLDFYLLTSVQLAHFRWIVLRISDVLCGFRVDFLEVFRNRGCCCDWSLQHSPFVYTVFPLCSMAFGDIH